MLSKVIWLLLRLTACRPLLPGLKKVDWVVVEEDGVHVDDADVNVDDAVEVSAGMILSDFDFNECNG